MPFHRPFYTKERRNGVAETSKYIMHLKKHEASANAFRPLPPPSLPPPSPPCPFPLSHCFKKRRSVEHCTAHLPCRLRYFVRCWSEERQLGTRAWSRSSAATEVLEKCSVGWLSSCLQSTGRKAPAVESIHALLLIRMLAGTSFAEPVPQQQQK